MSERGQTFAIVGGGLAGAKAAETLREEGFEGRVVLIGEEAERPYERPPLSKDYLRGELEREKVFVHDEAAYRRHEIELRLDQAAVGLDLEREELGLDGGERREGRLLAGMNVNVWEVSETIQELVARRTPVEVAALEDPDVPLAELARARA